MKGISPYQFAAFRIVLGVYLLQHFAFLIPYGPGGTAVRDEATGDLLGPEMADSPHFQVTAGHIRVLMGQAHSNDGIGGKNWDIDTGIGDRDQNGGDVVLIELWREGDLPAVPASDFAGGFIFIVLALGIGTLVLSRKMRVGFATA